MINSQSFSDIESLKSFVNENKIKVISIVHTNNKVTDNVWILFYGRHKIKNTKLSKKVKVIKKDERG